LDFNTVTPRSSICRKEELGGLTQLGRSIGDITNVALYFKQSGITNSAYQRRAITAIPKAFSQQAFELIC